VDLVDQDFRSVVEFDWLWLFSKNQLIFGEQISKLIIIYLLCIF
jgi:hypothetical protein